MKTPNIIMTLVVSLSWSCSNFLNVTPKNVISMDDMESIKSAFSGYLYSVSTGYYSGDFPDNPLLYFMNDFVEYTPEWDLSDYANDELTYEEIQSANWRKESTSDLWSKYYLPIGFMNLIIHEAETAEGDEAMRDYVMGEAYVTRAYCFFKLVQLFAPYNDNELGIPVCLESYEDFEKVSVQRVPQTEVYAQILSDLQAAAQCLERTEPRTTFNILYSSKVVNRLFAQVYHYKALSPAVASDDWDNAIAYADRETDEVELESNVEILKTMFDTDVYDDVENNRECAVRLHYWGVYSFYNMFRGLNPNLDFYHEYFPEDAGDIRRDWYYQIAGAYDSQWNWVEQLRIQKYHTYNSWDGEYAYVFCGFRLAETFLIQAEAYAMTDQLPEAKDMLDRFKQARYTQDFTVPNDKDGLLQEIYRERMREFVAEGDYIWLDMKRLGKTMERTIGGNTYRLEANDYRYTFPIPTSELDNNKEIRQNPGWNLND